MKENKNYIMDRRQFIKNTAGGLSLSTATARILGGEHKVRPYLYAFAGKKESLAVDLLPGIKAEVF